MAAISAYFLSLVILTKLFCVLNCGLKFSLCSSTNSVGRNKTLCCFNHQSNFKQHDSNNAKGTEFTKLCTLPSSAENVLIKRLNVLLNGNYFTVMLSHCTIRRYFYTLLTYF